MQGAPDRMMIADGQAMKSVQRFGGEVFDGFRIGETLDRFGQSTGLVKVEQGDFFETVPEGVTSNKDALTLHFGEKNLVQERQRESEGTGAGDDEDGDENLKGIRDSFSGGEPRTGPGEGNEDDGGEVIFPDRVG